MADKIIGSLKLLGTVGGGYIGYKYGPKVKEKILQFYPSVKEKYFDPFFKDSFVSEDNSFKIGGSLFGIMMGSQFWYVSIPGSIVLLSKDYPSLKKLFD